MERISVINRSLPEFGLYTRTSTNGIELDLVKSFIDYYCNQFLKTNKKNNLAVFIEPRISTGFPDVVFATYMPNVFEKWSKERDALDIVDLKILTYIIKQHSCKSENIVADLRFSEKQVLYSIEHLIDSGLIQRKKEARTLEKTSTVYGIKKLVTIEAKIGNIKKVAEQSFINTWFASHSYALIPTKPNESTISQLKKHGIGLYCQNKGFRKVLEAQTYSLPSSYVSLQFNEWIGRSLQ